MKFDQNKALRLLRQGIGDPSATFRPGQEDAIRSVVEGGQRLLVVQKTGWGKSFVYFIATRLLREDGGGPTLLISPLLSLMRNQIVAAERMGVRAATINSNNTDEWEKVEEDVSANRLDVIIISPERLANERFVARVLQKVAARIRLLVVDEAHCISDWGHEFRPDYRRLERIIKQLPRNLRVLATTATANNRVIDDLKSVLGPDLAVARGSLGRPSLTLQTIQLPRQAQRLAWLSQTLPTLSGSGIIYTLTIRDANRVSEWLRANGIEAPAYHSNSDARPELEDALLENRVKALVATSSLGMGYDKPDLGFVIHYQTPRSVITYYQQVGRAGRAISNAYGVLLSGLEEEEINSFFIDSAFPSKAEVEQVLDAIKSSDDGLSIPGILAEVNLAKGRVEKAIKLLSLESPAPIAKQKTKWNLTLASLSPEFWTRAKRLTALRRDEQAQMREYVQLETGHMQYLVNALDGEPSTDSISAHPALDSGVDTSAVRAADSYLRRTDLPLEPRKQWPAGVVMAQMGVRGRIQADRRAEQGRALSGWGDGGWGPLVQAGMYETGVFDDALVDACVQLLSRWGPTPKPEWVTCIPSTRHPALVPAFAAKLARALGLPFVDLIQKAGPRPQQKTMANGSAQARNVDGAFRISVTPRSSAVLLVDDLVHSRWTMTVVAWLLREGGSGPVHPIALARAGGGG